MVPVNARLERDTDVRFAAVSLENVLAATEGAALRVVILDACRNNPLARTMQRTSATRSISRGSFGELDEEALGDETLVRMRPPRARRRTMEPAGTVRIRRRCWIIWSNRWS